MWIFRRLGCSVQTRSLKTLSIAAKARVYCEHGDTVAAASRQMFLARESDTTLMTDKARFCGQTNGGVLTQPSGADAHVEAGYAILQRMLHWYPQQAVRRYADRLIENLFCLLGRDSLTASFSLGLSSPPMAGVQLPASDIEGCVPW